jgi:3-oxoacyl-[acyl-carrier-protein] synthase I
MGTSGLAVMAAGMITSLGDIKNGCAAARIGLSGLAEWQHYKVFEPEEGEMLPVKVHQAIAGVAEGFHSLGKLCRLGLYGIADMRRFLPKDIFETSRTGLVLNLPSKYFFTKAEVFSGEASGLVPDSNEDEAEFTVKPESLPLIDRLVVFILETFKPACVQVVFDDGAGLFTSLGHANALLASNRIDRCIVGGIDSFLEKPSLKALDICGVLKTSRQAQGLFPGEAAAFLLVEPETSLKEPYTRIPWAYLDGINTAREKTSECDREKPDACALAGSILATVRDCEHSGSFGRIIGNLNGTGKIAYEWGTALIRLPAACRNLPEWHPAEFFGETGAASGFLSICLACRAYARGYAETDNILIWQSSPGGLRGSLMVRRGEFIEPL